MEVFIYLFFFLFWPGARGAAGLDALDQGFDLAGEREGIFDFRFSISDLVDASQGRAQEVKRVAEVGFLDRAGFVREGESVWICRDGNGGDFEEFLLEVATAGLGIFDF